MKTSGISNREYEAPEILAGGNSTCRKNIDEYSVGVVMYYLLTGQHPFKINDKAKTDQELHQHLIS
jgi:serine/threonine protein kinase